MSCHKRTIISESIDNFKKKSKCLSHSFCNSPKHCMLGKNYFISFFNAEILLKTSSVNLTVRVVAVF